MLKSELVKSMQDRYSHVCIENIKALHNYIDLEKYEKLFEITDRLRASGAITREEEEFIMDFACIYYDGFLKWLDDAEELEIVVRSK